MSKILLEVNKENALEAICVTLIQQQAAITALSALAARLVSTVENIPLEEVHQSFSTAVTKQFDVHLGLFNQLMSEIAISKINQDSE